MFALQKKKEKPRRNKEGHFHVKIRPHKAVVTTTPSLTKCKACSNRTVRNGSGIPNPEQYYAWQLFFVELSLKTLEVRNE